jgi:hypothetical protein
MVLDLKLLFFYSFRYLFYFFSFDVPTELLLKHQLDAEEVTPETELLRLKLY